MKFGPGSAANRIALLGWLIYAAATLLLGIAVYFATHAAFSRQIDERIEQATSALLIEYHDDGVGGVQSALDQQGRNRPIGLGTALFDARGARIAGNLAIPLTEPGWRNIVFHDPGEGREQARAQVTVLPGNYRLVVAADLESLETIDPAIRSSMVLSESATRSNSSPAVPMPARRVKSPRTIALEVASMPAKRRCR